MTDSQPDSSPDSTPDPALAGAGLSATGRTADQMGPGAGTGTTYGDPGGTGTADEELEQGPVDADAGEDSEGAPA